MKKKVSVSWSGGKDSAFALYKILLKGDYDVVSLHTVFNAETKRVGMHGIHETLIEAQVQAIGIPLTKLYLSASEEHGAYVTLMKDFFGKSKKAGISEIVFGDIFLEDLKAFRDNMLLHEGLIGNYPLWKINSRLVIDEFLHLGFKTMICCANGKFLGESMMGKPIDQGFVDLLPANVDPCGENGEFHTFVVDGPIFKHQIKIILGSVVQKNYTFQVKAENGDTIQESVPFLFQDFTLSE